jgi:hypothetical protein
MVEERKVHLLNMYEALKDWRLVAAPEDKPSK